MITFIDLAGHERYLKTTVFGMTGHAPDFAMLMVSRKYLSVSELHRKYKRVLMHLHVFANGCIHAHTHTHSHTHSQYDLFIAIDMHPT